MAYAASLLEEAAQFPVGSKTLSASQLDKTLEELARSPIRSRHFRMKPFHARVCIGITTDADRRCLPLDSNILLRISKSNDPQHAAISQALHALVGQRVRLCYTSQTLGEFWNASTRPLDKNGFGLSIVETDRLARVIERDFELLPDSREVHDRWRSLLVAHNIQGVQVHDGRLAASMYVAADKEYGFELSIGERSQNSLIDLLPTEIGTTLGGRVIEREADCGWRTLRPHGTL